MPAKMAFCFLRIYANKSELVLIAAQMPHDFARLAIDFLYPHRRGNKKITVDVHIYCVQMKLTDLWSARMLPTHLVGAVVIPCTPLKYDVSIGIQLLYYAAGDKGVWITTVYNLGQVHLCHVITEQ